MPQLHRHVIGNALRVTLRSPFPGQLLKPVLRGQAIVQDLGRIAVCQLFQGKPAALCNLQGAGNGLGIAPEQALHLGGLFEKPVRMLLFEEARLVYRCLEPDACDDILQHPHAGLVIKHVPRHDCWHARLRGHRRDVMQVRRVVRTEAARQRAISAVPEYRFHPLQIIRQLV